MPPLRSDINAAVYVNWLVPTSALATHIPPPLELQTVGASEKHAVVTVVVFRHGHFGFRFLGPLRRLAPSPIQSNWRTYVRNPGTGRRGVFFLTTTVSNLLYTLMARLTADNVPMHRPRRSRIETRPSGTVTVLLQGGRGGTPDLAGQWQETPVPPGGPWALGFRDWDAMLGHIVPQERSLAVRNGRVVRLDLELEIPLGHLRPLRGQVRTTFLTPLVGNLPSWAFWTPKVRLGYHAQRRDRKEEPHG